jgi:hypothetical protein
LPALRKMGMAVFYNRHPPTWNWPKAMKPSNLYEIRVKGYLEDEWGDWFDGMFIKHEKNGETTLTGPIIDQPALFGLLFKVSSLNITLLSVNIVSID